MEDQLEAPYEYPHPSPRTGTESAQLAKVGNVAYPLDGDIMKRILKA